MNEDDLYGVMEDLKDRMARAAREMEAINATTQPDSPEFWRTEGKRQGILVAMDMLRGY